MTQDPLARRRSPSGAVALTLFGAAFLAAGLFFFLAMAGLPGWRTLAARSWPAVPCTLLAAQVESSSDSDGTTYRIAVRYRYQASPAGGAEAVPRTWEGDRYSFFDHWSSGYRGKKEVVDRLLAGGAPLCRVDPRDPSRSVLDTGIPGEMWLIVPFTLLFAAIGLGAVIFAWRPRRNAATDAPAPIGVAGGLELRPRQGRFTRLAIIAVVALFWNGIAWGAFLAILRDDARAWFVILLISLFLLVGLGLALAVVHQFLALGNPRPRLTLRGNLVPGSAADLTLALDGAVHRLRRFTVTLVVREEADYRQGTDTKTDRHELLSSVLLDEPEPRAEVQLRLELPAGLPPAFAGPNNRLVWELQVRGDIPRWPDVSEEFALPVAGLPGPVAPAAASPELEIPHEGLALVLAGAADEGPLAAAPGSTIAGVAAWGRGSAPKRASVRLVWHTQGKGTSDVVEVAEVVFAEPAAQDRQRFSFVLPLAPPSWSGRLITVAWAVVLEVDRESARRDLVVSASGQELRPG